MAKSHYTYQSVDVNVVGPVTTVDGVVSLTGRTYNELVDMMQDAEAAFNNVVKEVPILQFTADDPSSFEPVGYRSRADYCGQGYSKCSDEDEYDGKKGYVIASRRAELKATKLALKDVTEFERKLASLHNLVKEMEDSLDQKVVKFSVDLECIKSDKEQSNVTAEA